MDKFPRTALLLILCLHASILQLATGFKSQSISHLLPMTPMPLFQDTRERPSAQLVYGACDTVEPAYERNCSLVIETDDPPESVDRLGFCDFTLRSSSQPMEPVDYAYSLDNETVVVQWGKHYRRFAVVHMRACRVVYPKLDDDAKISYDLVRGYRNGTFDVVVQDSRKGSRCSRGKWCRMIFDVEGNVLEHPRDWIDEEDAIVDIVRTGDRSRMVVDMSHGESGNYLRVYKAYDNGMVNLLKTYPVGKLHASSKKLTVSTTHRLVTACALNYTKLTCSQFDHDGTLLLESLFKPLEFADLHSAKVFNRPGGGFVLMHLYCSSSECRSADDRLFTLRIFNPETKILRSRTFPQLKCGDEFDLDKFHFTDNGNDELCFSYVCDHREKDGRISTEVNCYSNND